MRCILGISLVMFLTLPVRAEVIASCGPLSGYSYFFEDELSDTWGWEEGPVNSITIFTRSGDELDVIIRHELGGEDWTRSASDYGAPVLMVGGTGEIMHILVAWGLVTELYSLDMKRKTLALVSHKTGLIDVTHAMVGECE